MGFIASSYYLKHQTVKKFSDNLKPGLSFKDLLRILSDAEEFKETPLRHNEDIHNK
jgi:activating signal cointegrator complex subunit 3